MTMSDGLIAPIDVKSAQMLAAPSGESIRKQVAGLDLGVDRTAGVDQLLGQFQQIFLDQMMSAMRETVPESSLFEDDTMATQTFQSLLDQEYVRSSKDQLAMPEITEALKLQLGLLQNPMASKDSEIPALPEIA